MSEPTPMTSNLRTWLLILAFLLRTTDLEPDDIVVREVS